MALPNLTPITKLATYKKTNRNPVVQVKRIEKMGRHKYKIRLSDGSDFHDAYIDCTLLKSKQVVEGCIVRLWEYLRAKVGNIMIIKILDLDVIPNIMPLDLTLRPIREMITNKSTRINPNQVVQVIQVEKTKKHKYKLLLSDGFYFHDAHLECTLMKSKQLEEGCIVRLDEYLRTSVDNTMFIKVLDISVMHTQRDIIGDPKPFPYRATLSVEDYYHVSLPEDEHPLLRGSCISVEDDFHASLPEDEHPLLNGSCASVEEQLERGPETEDEGSCACSCASFEEQLEDEGSCACSCNTCSCASVEEQLEWGTETEDFIML